MQRLNKKKRKIERPRTSYQRNDFLSSSSESLVTNLMLVVIPRNAKMTMARIGGRQSNVRTNVIANIVTSNDQRAMPWCRIIGIVFRPMAASPERSLKSCACPYDLFRSATSESECRQEGLKPTVSVNVRPCESMAIIDLSLMGS
jgi:hypothetical protein